MKNTEVQEMLESIENIVDGITTESTEDEAITKEMASFEEQLDSIINESTITEAEDDHVSAANNKDDKDTLADQVRIVEKTIKNLASDFKGEVSEIKAAIKAKNKFKAKQHISKADEILTEISDNIDRIPETDETEKFKITRSIISVIGTIIASLNMIATADSLIHFDVGGAIGNGIKAAAGIGVAAIASRPKLMSRKAMKSYVQAQKAALNKLSANIDKIIENIKKESEKISDEFIGYVFAEAYFEAHLDEINEVYEFAYVDYDEDDEEFTEGVNTDIGNIYKSAKSQLKENAKAYKKALKEKNFSGAKNIINDNIKIYNGIIKEMNEIKGDSIGNIFGALKLGLGLTIKYTILVFIPIVGPTAATVLAIKDSAKTATGYADRIKKSGDVTPGIANQYHNYMVGKVKELIEKNKKLIKKIDEKAKADKLTRESTEDRTYLKSLYEACAEGTITEEQREDLISAYRKKVVIEGCEREVEELKDPTVEESVKEKYNKVRKAIYERYANNEFNIQTREDLLEEARKHFFENSDDLKKALNEKKTENKIKADMDQTQKDIENSVKTESVEDQYLTEKLDEEDKKTLKEIAVAGTIVTAIASPFILTGISIAKTKHSFDKTDKLGKKLTELKWEIDKIQKEGDEINAEYRSLHKKMFGFYYIPKENKAKAEALEKKADEWAKKYANKVGEYNKTLEAYDKSF